MARTVGSRFSPTPAQILNHLSRAFLSAAFYILLSYQSLNDESFPVAQVSFLWRWLYQLIALSTFTVSIILSDREMLYKLGSPPWLSLLFHHQAQRWLGLVFSQCWLMITLDMLALNRTHQVQLALTNNRIPFSAFILSLATATSCFVSAAV